MDYAIYLASILGALGLALLMPAGRRSRRALAGAVLAAAAAAGLLLFLLNRFPDHRPGLYYYLFTAIALVAAVRVITHRRPVYSALYFILVVLAVAGLFLLLEAQFMAFAMILIYAGAILVTYLFVIMLATLPQSSRDDSDAPLYDRTARQPLLACLVGFALLAVLLNVLFGPVAGNPPTTAQPAHKARLAALADAVDKMPDRLTGLLARYDLLPTEARITGYRLEVADPDHPALVPLGTDRPLTPVALDRRLPDGRSVGQLVEQALGNLQHVGLNLFESHTLGIELAGVILLLAMVGAIVIARQTVPQNTTESSPAN